ncbi:MAG: hypothetical protein RMM58_03400 [Chloroflexota bacterium]|nr:hypothetical protein [Dehalococcoidia bacterium]MDW8252905.1 hypothetical protein [Chloroflexota bacterium]
MTIELPPYLPPPHVTPYLERMKPIAEEVVAEGELLHEEDGIDLRPQSLGYNTGLALGFKLPYRTPKLERFVPGSSSIFGRVHAQTFTAQAADGYDIPNLFLEWAELDETLSGVIDLFPLFDLALDEEYRKRVYDPLEPVWEQFRRFAGAGYHQNMFRFVRAFASPVYIGYHLPKTPQNVERCLAVHETYFRHWAQLVRDAQPLADPERAASACRRKRAMIGAMLSQATDINDLIPQLIGWERARIMGPVTAKGVPPAERGTTGLNRFVAPAPVVVPDERSEAAERFAAALQLGVEETAPFIPPEWNEVVAVVLPEGGTVSIRFQNGRMTARCGSEGDPDHVLRQSLADFADAVADRIPFPTLWTRLSEPANRDYVLKGNGLKLVYLYQAVRQAYRDRPRRRPEIAALLGVTPAGG